MLPDSFDHLFVVLNAILNLQDDVAGLEGLT